MADERERRAAEGRAAFFKNLRGMDPDPELLDIIEQVEKSGTTGSSVKRPHWKPRKGVRQG